MLALLRTAALVGVATTGALAAGLVRAKLSALWLGPSGVGLVAQAQTVSLLVGSVATGGLGTGLLACVARELSRRDDAAILALVDSALCIVAGLIGSVVLIATLGATWIRGYLFAENPDAGWALAAATVAGVFMALQPLVAALLYSFGKVQAYVVASLVSTALNVLSISVLLPVLGLFGALVHVALVPAVSLFVLLVFARHQLPSSVSPWGRWPPRPTAVHTRELLHYAAYSLTASTAYYTAQVGGRGLVLRELGQDANGLLQVAVAMGSYLRQFVSGGLNVEMLPAAAGAASATDSDRVFWDGQRIVLAVALPLATILSLIAEPLVTTLYSARFAGAAAILPTYLVSEIMSLLSLGPTTFMLARQSVRGAGVTVIVGAAVFLGSAALIIHRGIEAYAVAWGIGGTVSLLVSYLAASRYLEIRIGLVRICSVLSPPALILALLYVAPASYLARLGIAALVCGTAWTLGFRPEERRRVLVRAKSLLLSRTGDV